MGMTKQRLSQRETRFQWVESSMTPADVLTKGKERGRVADGHLSISHQAEV